MIFDKDIISVIVPIYNVEPYLKQCVESLLNQKYENLEIILVDDGSPDGCPAMCDAFAEKDSRVKVIHRVNGGLVSARKAGLEISKGKYVGFVDGDDWADSEMYNTLYQTAIESGADIIAAGYQRDFFGTTVTISNLIACGTYTGKDLEQEVYPRMLFGGRFFQYGILTYVWNKLFRRDILYNNQMQVDNRIFVGEDAACTYPCLLEAKSICVIESDLYHYRQRANSMLKARDNIAQEYDKLRVLYEYLKSRFSESEYTEILLPQLNYFLMNLVIIRSGGLLQPIGSQTYIFPFSNVLPGSQIVIFSSGTFGQHLYSQLKTTKYCDVVLWIDEDYEQSQALGLPVYAPENIFSVAYDCVLIASIDETVTEFIKELLMGMGVPYTKFAVINFDIGETPSLLRKLGFEVSHE